MALQLIESLVPLALPTLTFVAVEGLKKASAFVAGLPDVAKQVVVAAVSSALVFLAQKTGLPFPTSLEGFSPEVVTTLVTALTAMGMHSVKKALTPAQ